MYHNIVLMIYAANGYSTIAHNHISAGSSIKSIYLYPSVPFIVMTFYSQYLDLWHWLIELIVCLAVVPLDYYHHSPGRLYVLCYYFTAD